MKVGEIQSHADAIVLTHAIKIEIAAIAADKILVAAAAAADKVLVAAAATVADKTLAYAAAHQARRGRRDLSGRKDRQARVDRKGLWGRKAHPVHPGRPDLREYRA